MNAPRGGNVRPSSRARIKTRDIKRASEKSATERSRSFISRHIMSFFVDVRRFSSLYVDASEASPFCSAGAASAGAVCAAGAVSAGAALSMRTSAYTHLCGTRTLPR